MTDLHGARMYQYNSVPEFTYGTHGPQPTGRYLYFDPAGRPIN